MSDSYQPIRSPHPDLQVSDENHLVEVYPPAERSTLLYRGPIIGRWHVANEPHERIQDSLDHIDKSTPGTLNHYTEDAHCLGKVDFALWPDPHIKWWFARYSPPIDLSWPEMVPPLEISTNFATKAGSEGPPELQTGDPASAGESRLMYPVLIGDPNEPIDELRFYLVNFQVIQLADDILRGERLDQQALLRLRTDDWEIGIERRLDFDQAMNHMEERRGYAVTHNCCLRRKSDQGEREAFTFEEAESALEAVQLFASFVRGGMVGVALPVGYLGGVPVVEQWHVTSVDAGRYPDPYSPRPYHGWFIWYDGLGLGAAKWLPQLFSELAERWWDSNVQFQAFWRNVLRGLVYTYTDAERMDEGRGIVPACTALETLCWAILVETEEWLTGGRPTDGGDNEFDKLTAAGQIRLLLRWVGISSEIPSTLPKLLNKGKSSNWDGPQMVVWVRNRVAHPDRRDQLVDGISAESLHLAMSYIELIVLKLLGYEGYFRDRLDEGAIKRVPWAVSECIHVPEAWMGTPTVEAAELLQTLGGCGGRARQMAYLLCQKANDQRWAAEARAYNELITAWLGPRIGGRCDGR